MPNRRSNLEAHYNRKAQFEMLNYAYRDYELAETVCIQPFNTTLEFFSAKSNSFIRETVGVERGEVMADSRGRGSFQK